MGRPRRPLDGSDARAVRTRLKEKSVEGWQRQRMRAVQLGLEGKLSLQQIAAKMRVSPRTIGEWFERFRGGGLESLLTRKPKGKGPASWLDAGTERAFKKQLGQAHWRRAEDARQWLQEQLGRPLSLVVVYKYLGRFATRKSGVLVPKSGATPRAERVPVRRARRR